MLKNHNPAKNSNYKEQKPKENLQKSHRGIPDVIKKAFIVQSDNSRPEFMLILSIG